MSNSDDMDAWLAANGIPLETYGGILQSGSQIILISPNLAAFQKTILDWQKTYSAEVVSKSNSGVGQFTYLLIGQNKGFALTISNAAAAPGVVATPKLGMVVGMGIYDNILAWFAAHQKWTAFLEHAIAAGLGWIVLNEAQIIALSPQNAGILTIVIGILGAILNTAQTTAVAARATTAGKIIIKS